MRFALILFSYFLVSCSQGNAETENFNAINFQPDLNKIYFNENLKNLLKKKIPSQIKDIDDWYKFYMSTIQLFDKFALIVNQITKCF